MNEEIAKVPEIAAAFKVEAVAETKLPEITKQVEVAWKPISPDAYKYKKIGQELKTVTCDHGNKVKFTWNDLDVDFNRMKDEKAYVSCDFSTSFSEDASKYTYEELVLKSSKAKSYTFECNDMGTYFFATKFGSKSCATDGLKVVVFVTKNENTKIHRLTYNSKTKKNHFSYGKV